MAVETSTQCRLIEKKGLATHLFWGITYFFNCFFSLLQEEILSEGSATFRVNEYSHGVLMTALISTDIGDHATKICRSQCSYFITKRLINNTDVILFREGSVASTNAYRRRIGLVR